MEWKSKSSFTGGVVMKGSENHGLDEIKNKMETDVEEALEILIALDVAQFPKRQVAEVYWMLHECFLRQHKYMRSLLLKQKALDLDPSLACLVSQQTRFQLVDKVIQHTTDI